MASINPDPTTLGSSADIFSGSYTLPQIRLLHKSLHVQIEEKSTRLRTQVGGSYRQLLGTADTIVHMRGENEQVQDLLGKMGGRCGRSIISSKATGLEKFVAAREQTSSTTRETVRLKLLECCRLTSGRILQGGGGIADLQMDKGERLVMATKIFVISRLLVKSFKGGRPSERAQQVVDAAGRSLESLRRRLQRTMERLLEQVDETAGIEDVVQALCAYSLANSSGTKHAISHFIRVRQRAMETTLDMDHEERTTATATKTATTTGQDVVRSLKLYTKTILDVQALVPRKLSQALASLKSQPLLADTSLSTIEGLRLDICRRWCSEEMQDFTPFISHDDLDGNEAREMLASFAEKGAKVVVSGLERTLHHMLDFNSIIDLRTQVLQLWIRDGGRARGFDPQDVQDALRETFNARLLAVVEAKAAKLRLVGSEISATLQGWQDGVSDCNKGLWDDDGYDAALSNGVVPFLEEVVSRLHGRNDAVSKASHSYTSWFHIIDDVKTVVEQLRKQRWDNDYDEIEDEETMEARQEALSREDPRKLQETLDETLDASFAALEKQIQQLWDQHNEHTSSGAMAIYLIRVVRDIRAQLPDRLAVKDFGMSMVPGWHSRVAALAWRPAAATFISKGLSDKSVAMKPLWEGQPLLPGQPSPSVSHLLHDLSLAMTDLGVDLWTPAATGTLKKQLGKSLCEAWRKELQGVLSMDEEEDTTKQIEDEDMEDKADGEEREQKNQGDADDQDQDKDASKSDKPNDKLNGKLNDQRKEEPAEPNEKSPTCKVHDICTQWLFDVSLLQCCIGKTQDETASHYAELAEQLVQQSGLDEPARKRVAKMAGNYWRRINLLFGLVA
ncbi:hypothetical protein E4U58_003622 [Claviceps cyperi]|nr:hypothetical protein E4U58_003622 [Claviceps cyperi]